MKIERISSAFRPALNKRVDIKQTVISYNDCAGLNKTITLPHHATVQHIKALVLKRGGSQARVMRAVYRTNGHYVCEVGL